jgi:hypothetical protein
MKIFKVVKDTSMGLDHGDYLTYRTVRPDQNALVELDDEGRLFLLVGRERIRLKKTYDMEREGHFRFVAKKDKPTNITVTGRIK